jgi:transcriptional regulator with XRE-family HTH domain
MTRQEKERGMAVMHDPTVQRLLLGRQLKRARDTAGLKQADVAKAMEWSLSKLIRIESGQVSISTNDLKALVGHVGIKEKRRADALLELARTSRTQSWYDAFDGLLSPGFREYLAYEASASTIRQYEPLLTPGLVQEEEYARAVLRSFGNGDEDTDQLWTVRQHRQELHDRDDPPEVQIILDEAVIRRQVGGPSVMRRQLGRLGEMAAEPHVTLQILPFSLGSHPGMAGPFVVMQFDDALLDDLVHLESAGDATIRDDPEVTARYLDRFATLEKLALSPDESRALIDQAAKDFQASGGSASSSRDNTTKEGDKPVLTEASSRSSRR